MLILFINSPDKFKYFRSVKQYSVKNKDFSSSSSSSKFMFSKQLRPALVRHIPFIKQDGDVVTHTHRVVVSSHSVEICRQDQFNPHFSFFISVRNSLIALVGSVSWKRRRRQQQLNSRDCPDTCHKERTSGHVNNKKILGLTSIEEEQDLGRRRRRSSRKTDKKRKRRKKKK